MLHILHNILGYRKLAACWITHEISKVQQWHRYAVEQDLLDQYQIKGNDFHGWIFTMVKTWAHTYKPNLKCQSNEWKHPDSPCPKKVHPTKCAVKMMFIVVYVTERVILHQYCTSKADGKRSLLLHVSAASTSSSAQEKTMTQGGTNPHHSSWHCKESHCWQWEIHCTHSIWGHAITISSPKWKNHYEGPGTTQEMNL